MFSAQNRENEFSSKYSAFEKSFHGLASAADSFGYTRIYENIFFFTIIKIDGVNFAVA